MVVGRKYARSCSARFSAMIIYWVVINVAWIAAFAAGETYALVNQKTTLSQFVWSINGSWPLAVAIAGLVTGILTYHFYGTARVAPASESFPQIVIFVVFVMIGGIAAAFLWTKGG